jgi:hypothetical protein
VWSAECIGSFSDIKSRLTSAPILAHPDYTKPFILHTDASTVGLGAVLSQLDAEQHKHPIIFLSRSLTDAEKNYAATELECLAIVWAVRKLHPYLDGSDFTLITDHSALQWLFDYNGSNKRLVRWTMDLQPYRPHMTIRYKPGRVHSNADPLSRAPAEVNNAQAIPACYHITTLKPDDRFAERVRQGYKFDDAAKKVIDAITGIAENTSGAEFRTFNMSSNGLLLQQTPGSDSPRIYVPTGRLCMDILHDHHDNKGSAHLGTAKTLGLVGRSYYWPAMARDIKDYVRSCASCHETNPTAAVLKDSYNPCRFLPTDGTWSQWTSLALYGAQAKEIGIKCS